MRKRSTNQQSRRLGESSRQSQTPIDYENRGAEAFGANRYRDRTSAAYRETARQREYSPTPEAADTYSVNVSHARYSAAGKRKRHRRRVTVGIVAVLALVLVLAGSALGFFNGINNALHEGLDSSFRSILSRVLPGQPFYVLLMGTDESVDRQDDEELAGVFRTDTIILARVDPKEQTLTLVSIPRDTMVDLGEYGEQKINAAHAFGGPTLAVQTVENLTDVSISHYVEIDFDGFIGLVDALGGIEVDVPMTIDDEDAGGHVDAGLQTLNSWQALTLCRARNAYEEVVGQGDLYRAANQRLVLAAIVKKILASDPATMTNAVNACSQYVTTDLDIGEILDLANQFRGFDTEQKLFTAVFPTESAYIDEVWWDIADQEAWALMHERMQQGLPPMEENVVDEVTGTVLATAGGAASSSSSAGGSGESEASGNVPSFSTGHEGFVVVRNGTTYDGAGAEAGSILEQMGFSTDVDNADADDYSSTLIVYDDPSLGEEAQQIATALGRGAPYQNEGDFAFDGDFLVVIGSDWM